jgi:hypothetical protein
VFCAASIFSDPSMTPIALPGDAFTVQPVSAGGFWKLSIKGSVIGRSAPCAKPVSSRIDVKIKPMASGFMGDVFLFR